jgi:DNA-binding SARP family transcriptional activator
LEFRLLGPLEVIGDDGTAIAIGTGRQCALLALLILLLGADVQPVGAATRL